MTREIYKCNNTLSKTENKQVTVEHRLIERDKKSCQKQNNKLKDTTKKLLLYGGNIKM